MEANSFSPIDPAMGKMKNQTVSWKHGGGGLLGLLMMISLAVHAQEQAPTAANSRSGVVYRNDRIPEKPLSIHITKVDRKRTDLQLATTLAQGTVLNLSTLSDQIKRLQAGGQKVLAGINGDFYRTEREPYAGDPLGFQVMNGELVSGGTTNRPAFWIDASGKPWITRVETRFEVALPDGSRFPFQLNEERLRGTARLYTPRLGSSTQTIGGREFVLEPAPDSQEWLPLKPGLSYRARIASIRDQGNSPIPPGSMVLSIDSAMGIKNQALVVGGILELHMKTNPDTRGSNVAIGGSPTLLRQGKLADFKVNNDRHPRTAVGWNDESWFFVEVDGRQSNLSAGMTIKELAEYMQKLGATEAMNLDGGASATMWVFGQVVNSPCAGHERNTANGLVVVRKDASRRESD
ncbi:MAG: phosphodiester glycosidase family protein [Verrucomicrobia bacterium]|nr:phosphodiester glycosidase family protein [Verrucomicrobiota bacterium]